MRRISILIGACMVVALVLTVVAQQRDLDPVMKEIGPLNQGLRQKIAGNMAAEVAADFAKLEALFKETAAFMKAKSHAQGEKIATEAATAAAAGAAAAKAGDMATAKAKINELGCKACHSVAREPDPNGGYRFKAP